MRLHSRLDVGRQHSQGPALVDFEANLNGHRAAWAGAQADELELAEERVVVEEGVFSLRDSDANSGLHVARRREGPGSLARDFRVSWDDDVAEATGGFDQEGARCDVDEHGGRSRPEVALRSCRTWARRCNVSP